MSHEKVVAVYDTVRHAEAAVNTLESAGYPASDINLISDKDDTVKARAMEWGMWRRLLGEDLDIQEAEVYGRTVSQGGAIVSVRVPEREVPNVIKILDAHQPVDVLGSTPGSQRPETSKVAGAPSTVPASTSQRREEVVRLAEEQLNVGKREVDVGKMRVRRFVVERPAEANIILHEEHADVVRRPASDSADTKNVDWSEQVIEVRETAEQPVISKTIRVTEEVVIEKKGTDHVETIHDKVRRQQLEVEHVPAEAGKK